MRQIKSQKGDFQWRYILYFLLLIIVIAIVIPQITQTDDLVVNKFNVAKQMYYAKLCESGGLHCDRIVKDCSSDTEIKENKCSSFEIEKWKAYNSIKDCSDYDEDRNPICDKDELEAWNEYYEKYIKKQDDSDSGSSKDTGSSDGFSNDVEMATKYLGSIITLDYDSWSPAVEYIYLKDQKIWVGKSTLARGDEYDSIMKELDSKNEENGIIILLEKIRNPSDKLEKAIVNFDDENEFYTYNFENKVVKNIFYQFDDTIIKVQKDTTPIITSGDLTQNKEITITCSKIKIKDNNDKVYEFTNRDILCSENQSDDSGSIIDLRDVTLSSDYETFKSKVKTKYSFLEDEFIEKTYKISKKLDTEPEYLIAAMAFETGATFSPKIKNTKSGATGLIQFMDDTAEGLGTSTEALSSMTRTKQLDYVYLYLKRYTGKLDTLSDVYMSIICPVAIGRENLFSKDGSIYCSEKYKGRSIEYSQNSGLDSDNNGIITTAEATTIVSKYLIS